VPGESPAAPSSNDCVNGLVYSHVSASDRSVSHRARIVVGLNYGHEGRTCLMMNPLSRSPYAARARPVTVDLAIAASWRGASTVCRGDRLSRYAQSVSGLVKVIGQGGNADIAITIQHVTHCRLANAEFLGESRVR